MIAARSLLSKLLGAPWRAPNTLWFLFTAVVLSGPLLRGAPQRVQEVSRATLDNGLRVVIVHNSLAPVVTTVVNYLVGSNESPRGFPGMAHALEHMMFRGSPDLSADQLANIAAAMGGDFNADTQQSVTRYFFTVPKQDLDVALHIESIRMRNLLATDALWDRERGAIEQEIARRSFDSGGRFYTQAAVRDVPGNSLRARCVGYAAIFRCDHGSHAQEILRHLVRAEQRDPGNRR